MRNRAKLNGWRSNRSSAHASASGHLVLWNKKLLMAFPRPSARHNGVHAKRPPVVPASGLVDPALGDPARGPVSWRRRSVTQGYCENQVAEGPFSVGQESIFAKRCICATGEASKGLYWRRLENAAKRLFTRAAFDSGGKNGQRSARSLAGCPMSRLRRADAAQGRPPPT